MRDEWVNFTPRRPQAVEVAQPPRQLPRAYKYAGEILCQTAGELVDLPDQLSWQYAIDTANAKIMELHPAGSNLALQNELNDIAYKFRTGCYCAATAQLAVLIAQQTYC
jgi:hypothetical protein